MTESNTNYLAQDTGEQQKLEAVSQFACLLFAADHPNLAHGNYASPCEQQLLEVLAKNNSTVTYPIRILRGDLLPHSLASRVVAVDIPVRDATKRSYTHSQTKQVNIRSFATVIGDLCDSLKDGPTTANLVELADLLGRANIFCLTLNPLSAGGINFLDRHLRQFPPYLGAVALDPGNPLHIELFSEKLLDCVWIENGLIHVSRWNTDEGVYEFGLNPELQFRVIEVPWYEFQKTAPPRPRLITPTRRGAISAQRLHAATAPSHFEQVAAHLTMQTLRSSPTFPIELKIVLPAEDQMLIPVAKLIDYALNDRHDTGKHKAKLFSEVMAIGKDEWRFLAYQIRNELDHSRLERIEATQYGIQYRAQMEVVGLNGRIVTLETRWIIRQDEPAQLSTVFVADKAKQRGGVVEPPPWVPVAVKGEERWNAIVHLALKAGEFAADQCVPMPMKVEGYPVIMEGACGSAYVCLDGRLAFSRWLRANNYAAKAYPSGIAIRARIDSQSVDRAKAYCEAFVRVLWLNGIDGAKVEVYLS
ncbi:hypothetical protein HT746_07860 [Burkholderia pyrrocinia]|uniref:DUF6883 domain-containing protein n=1 Tax=Burkholderia pyrrocinia TaxID=60550 RepID=UPI0015777108|nr:DUF6883 domain-containing protein [Burkholderia pyrrocinia]NTX27047.1 hypothetical protein [Burkholderia pyrrocinia]